MVIILNKREDSIVVSINSETLVCVFNEETYSKLDILINTQFPKVDSMESAKVIESEVREVVAAQGNKAEENFVETACKEHLVHDAKRGTYHLKTGDGKIISKIPLPQSLVDRILISVEKGIDPTPVVKAVIRLFRNPKLSPQKLKLFVRYIDHKLLDQDLYDQLINEGFSKDKAKEKAEFLQTPITQEGLLVTYKVSKEVTTKWALDNEGNKKQIDRYPKTIDEDTGEISTELPKFVEDRVFEPAVQGRSGDAFWCEPLDGSAKKLDHIYKVGAVQYLESWDQVNCTDGIACVKGLHLGNLDYIRNYEKEGTATHNCFVDPMHIGAFTDNGDGAIRVKQLMIHSSKEGDNRGIYFSSAYAAHTDKEWEAMKAEAIKNSEEKLADLKEKNAKEMELFETL